MKAMHGFAASVALALAATAHGTETFEQIAVTTRGSGPPVILIPGLNSAGSVWDATCEALERQMTCHIVHLPGFAGAAPATGPTFLPEMRDRIIRYAEARELQRPLIVGHSLGGSLALMIALQRPELPGALVIVDALPFFPAARNPAITPAAAKTQAEHMRTAMQAQSDEAFFSQSRQFSRGMSRDPARSALIEQWLARSDRQTTTQAIYELNVDDLRPQLAAVRPPTVVIGSWVPLQAFGQTRESTLRVFTQQFEKLAGVRIVLSDVAHHFVMWDDAALVQSEISQVLARQAGR